MPAKHPCIGIVVPVFGHSRLVGEALVSAIDQSFDGSIVIVVVVDGDPAPETTLAIRSLALAGERPVYTIFRRNGRLPAARNSGIDLLLQIHPELDAIYFLDADNRLSSHSLSVFWETLSNNPTAAWAYPDIGFIGLTWGAGNIDFRETAPAYDPLRHLMGNICEAGSMVRGDVFRRGLRFDEAFSTGYEDWEFWLQCLDLGLVGAPATGAGFQYRRRSDSMLAEADRSSAIIKAKIYAKHRRLFSATSIAEKFKTACATYVLATDDGNWRLLSADGSLFRQGNTTLHDLIESAREHFHFTYLPRFALLPLKNQSQLPTVSIERTLALLADPQHLHATADLRAVAQESAEEEFFEVIPITALSTRAEPRLTELSHILTQIDIPSAHRVDRRYAGPAAFQIEQFVRERLVHEEGSAASPLCDPVDLQAKPALKHILIDPEEVWLNHPFRVQVEKRLAGLERGSVRLESKSVNWTRFAGRIFPYFDSGFKLFSDLPQSKSEFAVIVADSRALFYCGELKRFSKHVAFVTPANIQDYDFTAIEAAEHALTEIYCTSTTAVRLRSVGVPLRKIVILDQTIDGLTGAIT